MTDRGLIIYNNGCIDEVDEEGNITSYVADGLYEELDAAGYPSFDDPGSETACFDIRVDAQGRVTAHKVSSDPGMRERAMGEAPPLLAAWLRDTEDR